MQGETEPVGKNLFDPQSFQCCFGIGISLLGCFTVPIDGLCVIFRDPLTVFITCAEIK